MPGSHGVRFRAFVHRPLEPQVSIHGLFLTRPTPEWLSYAWAGVLLGGDAARLGGLAAAHLHGIEADPPAHVLVLVDADVRRRDRDRWRFRRQLPGRSCRPARGEPPRVCVEDAVLDLCDNGTDDPAGRSAAHWISELCAG